MNGLFSLDLDKFQIGNSKMTYLLFIMDILGVLGILISSNGIQKRKTVEHLTQIFKEKRLIFIFLNI